MTTENDARAELSSQVVTETSNHQPMLISLRLRAWRLEKDLTQEGAARLMDVRLNVYGAWERGTFEPSVKGYLTIAKAMGVAVGELIESHEAAGAT